MNWYSGKRSKESTYTLVSVSDLHSTRLFCSGVPVSTTLRRVLTAFVALEMLDASLRRMCPSSQTTKSGPEKKKNTDETTTISTTKAMTHKADFLETVSCYYFYHYWTVTIPGSTSNLWNSFFQCASSIFWPSDRLRYNSYPIIVTPPLLCHLCRALSRSGRCFFVTSSVTCNIFSVFTQ